MIKRSKSTVKSWHEIKWEGTLRINWREILPNATYSAMVEWGVEMVWGGEIVWGGGDFEMNENGLNKKLTELLFF